MTEGVVDFADRLPSHCKPSALRCAHHGSRERPTPWHSVDSPIASLASISPTAPSPYEGINEEDARKYIGARGLGVKYLLDNGPETDANSPDNMLAVVNGPLTGTEVTMSGRLAFVTKSPLTGTVTDSHMGGWSAAPPALGRLRRLLITGKADSPVYLHCENNEVEIPATLPMSGGLGVPTTPSSTSAPPVATPPTSQSCPSARPARTASSSHRL